jgi:hypothetical protein
LVSGNGINQFGLVEVSATQLTTNIQISGSATLGARNVTVSTSGGVTAPVTFTIVAKPPAPTLTSISPNSGTRGSTVTVTLTGTNFSAAGLAVNVSGTGVTPINVTYVSSTQVKADFVIGPNANTNNRNVTVTTSGGTSGSRNFTVSNPPRPTLASIAPTVGTHGTNVTVTLTGTNFTSTGTFINVTGTGVVATVTSVTPTQIVATFAITSGALHTARAVNVTTPGGTNVQSQNRTFTVN